MPASVGERLSDSRSPGATSGKRPSTMESSSRLVVPGTQSPCLVMPTGTTSKRSRSRLSITAPADRQEIECSPDLPP